MNPINPGNLSYIEELYAAYRKNSASVGREWQAYFSELARDTLSPTNGNAALERTGIAAGDGSGAARYFASTLQEQLNDMIRAYRTLGHRAAQLDPLGQQARTQPELDPAF